MYNVYFRTTCYADCELYHATQDPCGRDQMDKTGGGGYYFTVCLRHKKQSEKGCVCHYGRICMRKGTLRENILANRYWQWRLQALQVQVGWGWAEFFHKLVYYDIKQCHNCNDDTGIVKSGEPKLPVICLHQPSYLMWCTSFEFISPLSIKNCRHQISFSIIEIV